MNLLKRLAAYSPTGEIEIDELPFVQCGIDNLQRLGWTDNEIVSKLKWMEHVNPEINEDVALRNMRLVDERVAHRLSS